MYITGGIGASGGNEGFAEPYHLPNMTAYCETCASIGSIFFNHRMFSMHGEGKYFDILEKTLYNGALSGVSLSGDRFFYPNPLESDGRHGRSPWFGCACCPSNVCRFIPAIPGYIYSVTDKDLFVNLFASNEAEISFAKNTVSFTQETMYPWDGKVTMTVSPAKEKAFALHIRIPGWARNEAMPGGLYEFTKSFNEEYSLLVNGEAPETSVTDGYVTINRKWKKGDRVELYLPMPVRTVVADDKVKEDAGRYAIQRGPLMFCAEWPDHQDGKVLDILIAGNPVFTTEFQQGLLNGTELITTTGYRTITASDGTVTPGEPVTLTLIPYHLWNNRGKGEMRVWIPYN